MIVDVHTHLMDQDHDLSPEFLASAGHARDGRVGLTVRWEDYSGSSPSDSIAIVFGGKARLSGLWVDDRRVADYVREHAPRTIGFLSLDPTQPGWQDELRYGHEELGLRGVKLMPMYAGFDPSSPEVEPLWTYAVAHHLPVLMHTGTTFVPQAVLKYTRPVLADDIARSHPDLVLILAHLGHPYEGECLAVIRKHRNVYADISALHYRPYQFWNALMLAKEYGVTHKLLFGSDFPFTTVNASVDGLRELARITMPSFGGLDEDQIEQLIHRDSLSLLGLRP